jgi:hypothetical protein
VDIESHVMKHSIWSWLLPLALLWQSLLAVAPSTIEAQSVAMAHALLHDEGVGHHHHDADSLTVEDLGAPTLHQHHDGGHFHALPWSLPSQGAAYAEPLAPDRWQTPALPSPFLEGPLRPPRVQA